MGGVPLALGLRCGHEILMIAVLSILLTAPLGALLMDVSYKRLLQWDGLVDGGAGAEKKTTGG